MQMVHQDISIYDDFFLGKTFEKGMVKIGCDSTQEYDVLREYDCGEVDARLVRGHVEINYHNPSIGIVREYLAHNFDELGSR